MIVGIGDATLTRVFASTLRLPGYFTLLTAVHYAIFWGFVALLIRGVLSLRPSLRRLQAHPFSLILPAAMCIVVLGLGNHYFLARETDPSSLVFDVAVLAVFLAVGSAMLRIGGRMARLSSAKSTLLSSTSAAILLLAVHLIPSDDRSASGGKGRSEGGSGRSRPNLVLLVLDTLRNDHMSWMGYDRETTPNLDQLASEGAILTQLVTQASNTKGSCASLLTSLYPTSHTAIDIFGLPDRAVTLAEVLSDNGYATFIASANRWISPVFGFHQGFDRIATLPYLVTGKHQIGHTINRLRRRFVVARRLGALMRVFHEIEMAMFWDVSAEQRDLDPTGAFLNWMDEETLKPFFAYLQFMEPHSPYQPPPPFDTMFSGSYSGPPVNKPPPITGLFAPLATAPEIPDAQRENMVARYDGEIRYLDARLKRLFDYLDSAQLMENTVVVVVGDHGESFFERGMWSHGGSLYDEELRPPLAIIHRGRISGGQRINELVRMVDLMPTLLDLLEVTPPEGLQGTSFADRLLGGSALPELPAYSEIEYAGQKSEALRKGNLKFIRAYDGSSWLFDLEGAGEAVDVSDSMPDAVAEMEAEMARFRDYLVASRIDLGEETQKDVMDEETYKRLRALGYIQ